MSDAISGVPGEPRPEPGRRPVLIRWQKAIGAAAYRNGVEYLAVEGGGAAGRVGSYTFFPDGAKS